MEGVLTEKEKNTLQRKTIASGQKGLGHGSVFRNC